MAIIVGDIHGSVEKVKAFLAYKPDEEHVALGDYLDSFHEPQERQIEALQMLLDSKTVLLWGNHDLHYLKKPPFLCTGFQYSREEPLQNIIEANKGRFQAAYAVDGWLCTHAGVSKNLVTTTDICKLAERFNRLVSDAINGNSTRANRTKIQSQLFGISRARRGEDEFSGIFWFDYSRDPDLAVNIKQIFGHTETRPEPTMTDNYVALDTTNNRQYCWVYDTFANELVRLDLPEWKPKPYQPMTEEDHAFARKHNSPRRISDLPKVEQESFASYLRANLCSRPLLDGMSTEEQDGYWPSDYRRWKAGVEAREQHALEHYPRLRDLPEEERGPFSQWLEGQTRPYIDGLPREEQDFFYLEDYRRWKAGLEPFD